MSTPDERPELMRSLAEAIRTFSDEDVLFEQEVAARLGVPLTDFKCLNRLRVAGALTAGELAELTGLTTGAVTALVDRMERRGLVRRVRDREDRRRVTVVLRPERRQQISVYLGPTLAALQHVCDRYDGQSLRIIIDFLAAAASTLRLRRQEMSSGGPRSRVAGGRGSHRRQPGARLEKI